MQHLPSLIVLVILALVVGMVGAQEAPLEVVATTSILADVARQVGGEWVTVQPLLPPNTDTHAFQPAPADVIKVAGADMLLVVGAGYESFLGGLLENAGNAQTIVVSNGVEILPYGGEPEGEATPDTNHEEEEAHTLGILGEAVTCEAGETHEDDSGEHAHGECDPHVWLDPENVMIWTRNIADAFAAADPAHADEYQANADVYIEQLAALNAELEAMVAQVPEARRVLVTNHEFLAYFADAYGFEVLGTVLGSVSTSAEPSPQELAALIETIEEHSAAVVFVEVTANSQLADVVGQEAGVEVVTTLYTESLSEADGSASTYIDLMRYNTQTIVDALAGS